MEKRDMIKDTSNNAIDKLLIGIETHVAISPGSRLFSPYPSESVCPISWGIPGAVPVLTNKSMLNTCVRKLACGLNGSLNLRSVTYRKHYFYPDTGNNYQLTQSPIIFDGILDGVNIRSVHLEADAASIKHGSRYSHIDYKRAGSILLEIVTEPCIKSIDAAERYLKNLRGLIIFLGISDCAMESGQYRFDCNFSIGGNKAARWEIKNLNSFKFMKSAFNLAVDRYDCNGCNQTLGFNDHTETLHFLRSKQKSYGMLIDPNVAIMSMHAQDTNSEKEAVIARELVDMGSIDKATCTKSSVYWIKRLHNRFNLTQCMNAISKLGLGSLDHTTIDVNAMDKIIDMQTSGSISINQAQWLCKRLENLDSLSDALKSMDAKTASSHSLIHAAKSLNGDFVGSMKKLRLEYKFIDINELHKVCAELKKENIQ